MPEKGNCKTPVEPVVSCTNIKTFIKPVATYGMEIWDAHKCDRAA
jgi:hypothetical protein